VLVEDGHPAGQVQPSLRGAPPGTACGLRVWYGPRGDAGEAEVSGEACPLDLRPTACAAALAADIGPAAGVPVREARMRFVKD
jgi:hypothetical protein